MTGRKMRGLRIACLALLTGLVVMFAIPRPANASLTIWSSVIDFGRSQDRLTIRGALNSMPRSNNPQDFTIRVIIVDNRTGQQHDSGPITPTITR